MKAILIVLGVLLLILAIIVFPFRARFQGHFNLFSGICIYSIKIVFIKLLVGRCKVSFADGLKIENMVNNMPKDPKHPHLMDMFASQVLKRIEISKFDFYFTFGESENASTTALVCGSIKILSAMLISYILNNNKNADIFQDINPSYTSNEFELTMQVSVKLSLLDVLLSFISAKKEYKKVNLRG